MAALGRRERTLQLALLLAGGAAVAVADRTAGALAASLGAGAPPALIAVGGFVVGGWAVGMALRLQLAPSARPDPALRLLLGVPAGALAGLPLALAWLPSAWAHALPGALLDLQRVAPFGGVVLGLVLALAVRAGRR